MEAWKSVDYSSLSPPCALSLTTERWGFDPLPSNLVAISGYWQDIEKSNNTVEPAWTLPSSCPSVIDSTPDSSYNDGSFVSNSDSAHYSGLTNILGSANICPEGQSSAGSGCIILIEGIGKTVVGPANSNIVGLSHGISFLVIIATTFIIIMGSCWSTPDSRQPTRPKFPRHGQLRPVAPVSPEIQPYLIPVPPPQAKYMTLATKPANVNTAEEVAQCSGLLRELYTLELKIWGMEGNIAEDKAEQEVLKHQANLLFVQISKTVDLWRSNSSIRFSAQEQQLVASIYEYLRQDGLRRYSV